MRYLRHHGFEYDLTHYDDKINELLKLIIKKGISVEINTSDLLKEKGDTMPPRDVLERYYNMGGRLITFGSDAHRPERIANGIKEAYSMAKEIGFEYSVIYNKRKLKIIPLCGGVDA